MSRRRAVVLALVAVALLACSAAVLIQPATMGMLVVAVGAAEYSPFIAIADLVWALVLLAALRHLARARIIATLLMFSAMGVAVIPLVSWPSTIGAAMAQLGGGDIRGPWPRPVLGETPPPRARVHERTIVYRAADGTPLSMQLYQAMGMGTRPTVVMLYGGAWRSGAATDDAALARALASRGYSVASIDYRHAPAARFPAQLDDVRGSLALLRDSAAAWQVDPTRLALLGRSSGGHLAELAAWSRPEPGVRAVIAIYAPFDLLAGYRQVPSPDPIDVRQTITAFLGGTPAQVPARYRDASPSTYVRAGLPPTLLLYGARDHVVLPEFNRAAAQALRAANVPVVQVEVPWAEHGFDMARDGLGAQLEERVVAAFLAKELGSR
jgi:acetyl esterase/lipase